MQPIKDTGQIEIEAIFPVSPFVLADQSFQPVGHYTAAKLLDRSNNFSRTESDNTVDVVSVQADTRSHC